MTQSPLTEPNPGRALKLLALLLIGQASGYAWVPSAFAASDKKIEVPVAVELPSDGQAWAVQSSAPEFPLNLTWVDAKGNTSTLDWKSSTQISWPEIGAPDSEKPNIIYWLQIPTGFSLNPNSNAEESARATITQEGAPGSGAWARFECDSYDCTTSIQAVKGETRSESQVVSSPAGGKPAAIADPSCDDAGLRFYAQDIKATKEPGAKPLFVAARCFNSPQGLQIRLSWIGGSQPKIKGLLKTKRDAPNTVWIDVSTPPPDPKQPADQVQQLGQINFGSSTHSVFWTPHKKRKLKITAGLAVSIISYHEAVGQIDLAETVLTGKATLAYRFNPKWDSSLSAFATLLPILSSPGSLPSSRFWGFNARAGYTLPKPTRVVLTPSVGYYFMGMATGGNYGFSSASGPQIFFVASAPATAKREMAAYFKFSVLSNGFALSPGNSEAAVGGSYQLASISGHPLALTLDLSRMGFSTADGTASFSSMTASVGVQSRY